jgi:DNA segregation ATPase FtsK/SpoIIIE, S-DNA-T family
VNSRIGERFVSIVSFEYGLGEGFAGFRAVLPKIDTGHCEWQARRTHMENQRSVRWDVAAVVMFAVSAFLWLSLLTHDAADNLGQMPKLVGYLYSPLQVAFPFNEQIQNSCGYLGALVSDIVLQATGIGAYLIAGLSVLSGVVMLRQKPWASSLGRSIGWSLILLSVCCMPQRFGWGFQVPVPIGGGGYLGAVCNLWMDRNLATAGSAVLVLSTFVGGLLLSTEYAIVRYLGYVGTGSLFVARYFRIPKWTLGRHKEMLEGTFSPNRSDLPKSLTLSQDSATVTAPSISPVVPARSSGLSFPSVRGAIESVAKTFSRTMGESTSEDGASSDSSEHGADGPAIKIGRRAEANISSADLATERRGPVRTDLTVPKPKPLSELTSKPTSPIHDDPNRDEDEYDEEEYDVQTTGAYEEDDSEFVDDEDADDDEIHKEEDEEDEEITQVVPPKPRSLTIRSDAAHIEERTPNIKNNKTKKPKVEPEKEEEDPAESLQYMDDTKLPEGSEEYVLPGLDLLTESDEVSYEEQNEEVRRKAKLLEQAFDSFGFNVKVVEIETGPVIAQYEIELEAGLRLSKITSLAEDLAIALRVPSVRIVAPIPGKNSVGIEVPNEKRQIVRMREVIEESGPQIRKQKIPLFLGKDVSGKSLTVDLASLPHLLIAGRTGTGKSVCLNSIISSILMTRRPDEVRMLMIDPKMVELSCYGRLPHLMHPVVIDMRKAEAILAWAVDKMEERYSLLARAGVRHLTNYNQLDREELLSRLKPENDDEADLIPDHLPFIVIVVDEMADLMMTAGKEVEAHIIRLAQKSRAVGIHLILATQKPTVDVITGLIKSNLPARISFQVASRTDSRVVLDEMGADKLLGNGDMLFLWPGTSQLLRGQGTYLSDDEINAVVDHCSMGGVQNFVQELVQLKVTTEDGEVKPGTFKRRDDLYEAAVDIVVREGRGSCSLLQRALGIGYGRAARLIDFMAEDGIVGEYNGSQAREVSISIPQWEAMRANADGESGGSGKRGKKIRRDEGWSETPKKPNTRKGRKPKESEDAVVGDVESPDEDYWEETE